MSVDTESARIFAQLIDAMASGPGVDEATARDAARVLRELSGSLDHARSEMARLAGSLELALSDAERDLAEARKATTAAVQRNGELLADRELLKAHAKELVSVVTRVMDATVETLVAAGVPEQHTQVLRAQVAELAALDQVAHPKPPIVPSVLDEVQVERDRQNAKWGEQNHQVGGYFRRPIELADDLRRWLREGSAAWELILLEEVAEAWDAIGNENALRAELVQVAAVAVAWVEAIDRREAPRG